MSSSQGKPPVLRADKRYAAPAKPKAQATGAGKKPPPKKRAPRAARRRRTPAILRPFTWALGLLFQLFWKGAIACSLILAGFVLWYAAQLPPVEELLDARLRGSVTLLDRDGKTFAWRGEQFGGTVSTETVSPYLKDAIVATEDKRFYIHFGVSPRGIASAIRINLREGRGPLEGNGGSTITQQVAKLLCLGVPFDAAKWKDQAEYEADCRRTTMSRKVKEAIFAMAMEWKYSKDDILTIYMNRSFLGAGANGFEAAAQRYFGKSAANVTPAEAAMLAGLLKAPTRFAPTANLQRSQDRAKVIVGLMEAQGYLTTAEADEARNNPAVLSEAAQARAGGYFADWVMDSGPAFLTRDTTEDVIIRTTFDARMQKAAEDALQFIFDTKVSEGSKAQAAIVVMSADGAVRAMVGGRTLDGVPGQFNRAIQARRQTGSSFKPFVYATALDLGYSPYEPILDEPWCTDVPGSGLWCPENYDHEFKGQVTLLQALAESRNVPAAKLALSVGLDNVRRVASDFGIASEISAGPAMALGSSESTLIEMTGAYAGILNGGQAVTPYGLIELKLLGEDTILMDQGGGFGERVISQDAAQYLIYMMRDVVESGTGARARIDGREVAGKTGTTSAARDAWFIGFSADYVTGVWMGYDDNTPLKGVTGGGLPAEIWRETMVRIHEGLPANPLPMLEPEPIYVPPPEPEIVPLDGIVVPGTDGQVQLPTTGDQKSDKVLERLLDDLLNNKKKKKN